MIIYEIKKSKFITQKFEVKTKQEVKKYLKHIKQNFKDASHICYAYIIENGKSGGKVMMASLKIVLVYRSWNY